MVLLGLDFKLFIGWIRLIEAFELAVGIEVAADGCGAAYGEQGNQADGGFVHDD